MLANIFLVVLAGVTCVPFFIPTTVGLLGDKYCFPFGSVINSDPALEPFPSPTTAGESVGCPFVPCAYCSKGKVKLLPDGLAFKLMSLSTLSAKLSRRSFGVVDGNMVTSLSTPSRKPLFNSGIVGNGHTSISLSTLLPASAVRSSSNLIRSEEHTSELQSRGHL